MRLLLFSVFILLTGLSGAQIVQNVRGNIVDMESKYALVGVKVQITTPDSLLFRALSDQFGNFLLRDVPLGKYEISFDYNFYNSNKVIVVVQSGKESIVNVDLEEEISTTEEVEIIGNSSKDVQNEMGLVSAQQFSIEETERYPGSRADPARMASNFAGVQGADDTRNDIVIRGNSPLGLIYKVEGIDIPNPNHFAVSGSAGGPVAIINNKILGNSDFFMSAFPAEFGNSISGVFDLKFRDGNQTKHELTGQFGFLGTEIMAEGPINKEKRSSYLIMGRYSTLSMFQAMGVSIGTDAVPVYGDGAFKFSFPQKKGGNLSFFGMGGASSIDIVVSNQTQVAEESFGEGDRDQYFRTSMGIVGATYKKPINENTFIKTTVATTFDTQNANHNFLVRSLDTTNTGGEQQVSIRTDSIYPLMGYRFKTNRLSWYGAINHKIGKQHIIKAGFNMDAFMINNIDSALNVGHDQFRIRHDFQGSSLLIQPFFQYKWKVNGAMDLTAGIHSQYFSLSNSFSYAEPRLGWQYRMKNKQVLSAGGGLHSQTQPLYQYTYQRYDSQNNPVLHNKNMDFTRSIHSAIGYEKTFKKSFRFKTEVYYQQLYNIPIDMKSSAFSLINQGSGFQRFFPDTLVNNGTARNYGVEVTVQKFFDQSFFYLITASFFESKYTGSDGKERDTDFNGNYAANFLAGKEFKVKDKNVLSLGLKFTVAGGRRYGYVNIPATLEENELVFLDEGFNERQFEDYYRLDFRVTYKINTKKLTHEIGLDLVNILNTQNLLALSYAPSLSDPTIDTDPTAERYQLGFLPIFYYRIDFRLDKLKKG